MKIRRVIFCGTSAYGCPSLSLLANDTRFRPILVISQPDRPSGRNLRLNPSPISELAVNMGLKLQKPSNLNDKGFIDSLSLLEPDIIITASYGEFLGKGIRNVAAYGAINLHPSLLPKYRGASPIQAALAAGDKETGISIFKMNSRMDAGEILLQRTSLIAPQDNWTSLHDRLALESADMLLELLEKLETADLQGIPQDETAASYAGKINREDMLINWNNTAENIHNHIRSLAWNPGAYQYLGELQLKILETAVLDEPAQGEPGTVHELIKNTGFTVNAKDQLLLVKTVQPAGKKAMSGWAFTLGTKISAGSRLWK